MAGRSLVQDLQELATDKSNDITDLLRKALLVATKLKVGGFREWIACELNGYGDREVPNYRTARADLKAINPYRGHIPFVIADPKLADAVSRVNLREGVGTYLSLLEEDREKEEGYFVIPFTDQQKLMLTRGQDVYMEPERIIGRHKLATVIDAVRTMILDWSLKLEDEGILGEGLAFSEEEKQKAAVSTQIRIENFQGVLGDVTHSSVAQNLQIAIRNGDFDSLRGYLQAAGVEAAAIDELESAINSDTPPTTRGRFGENVSAWIGKMVSKAAQGLGQLPMGTASSLLANAIWQYYGFGSM